MYKSSHSPTKEKVFFSVMVNKTRNAQQKRCDKSSLHPMFCLREKSVFALSIGFHPAVNGVLERCYPSVERQKKFRPSEGLLDVRTTKCRLSQVTWSILSWSCGSIELGEENDARMNLIDIASGQLDLLQS